MTTMHWFTNLDDERAVELLGYIPTFLAEDDPRSAKEQLHANYAHGGGWHEFKGFNFDPSKPEIEDWELRFPGDPPMKLIAATKLHDKEVIAVFENAWVAIVQKDLTYEIARMD